MMEYNAQNAHYLSIVEKRLEELCRTYLPDASQVCRAARYSLLGGGKRVRAVLTLAACDMLGGDCQKAATLASALEMVHCYSLIHDDLPCMDNDDFRRGRPSCHKAFDEATAMLAGDALLTAAFEVVSEAELPADAVVDAVKTLSFAAGGRGMVYGQELDLIYEQQAATEEQLRLVHQHKTGALINAAVQLGAIAALAGSEERTALKNYAAGVGLVFQIVDDVLDVTATEAELGKPIGSDAENGKTTFATLYGPQGAMELAQEINRTTCLALQERFGEKADFLLTLASELVNRKN